MLEQRVLLSAADGQIFATSNNTNVIGEYSTSGTTVNASLVSGLQGSEGIAVSGSDLFVANFNAGTIGEYTTSGATVNASLVSGLFQPRFIAVSGSDLFVTSITTGPSTPTPGIIGEYTTSGATVNASLVSGLADPFGIAVSGSDLFVTNPSAGTIGEYTTSGATVNASLISGLSGPGGIAVSGSDLFVGNSGVATDTGTIGEYTTSGATVNASLLSGLDDPFAIAASGSDFFVTYVAGVGTIGEYTTSGATVNASLVLGVELAYGICVEASGTPAAPPGSVDPAFNNGNPVSLGFAAQASAVTASGQTLLAGLAPGATADSTAAVLEQLNSDGSIDTAFGTSGTVTDSATSDEAFYGVVTESDGTIFAAGTSNGDLLLAGYNADGSADTSFGTAPTATPLPVGTLGASVSASLPAAVVGGAKARASALVTVTNPTSQTLSGPATVTLYVCLGQSLGGATQLLAVKPKLKLKPHAHTALRFKLSSFPSLPAGSYYLVASITAPDGTITGAAGPALTISPPFVSILTANLRGSPAAVAPGKKLSLILTLQNNGNELAAGTAGLTVSLSSSPAGAGAQTVAATALRVKLASRRSKAYKVKFAVPAGTSAGSYYLAASLAVSALGDATAADGMAASTMPITVT